MKLGFYVLLLLETVVMPTVSVWRFRENSVYVSHRDELLWSSCTEGIRRRGHFLRECMQCLHTCFYVGIPIKADRGFRSVKRSSSFLTRTVLIGS